MTFLNPFLIVFYKLLYIHIFQKFFECLKLQLKLSAKYYQGKKKGLQKKPCKRYENLFKEEKDKKRKYGCERYKNL